MTDINRAPSRGSRCLVVTRQFPSLVQPYVVSHARLLEAIGFAVHFCASAPAEDTEVNPEIEARGWLQRTRYLDLDGLHALRTMLRADSLRGLLSPAAVSVLRTPEGRALRRLKWALGASELFVAGTPVDLVHSHSLFSTFEFLFAKRTFGIPIVTTFHGREPANAVSIAEDKQRKVFDIADVFLVNTCFARDQLLEEGCPAHKIRIVPQCTDPSRFRFVARSTWPRNGIEILSVGRISAEKGFDVSLRACAALIQEGFDLRYRFVGDGSEREALERLATALGVRDRVVFEGRVPEDRLVEAYAKADLLIVPSIDPGDGTHVETQCVVLQEAQASGLPVVASRVGGIPEVVDEGCTGLLFEPSDVDDLRNVLAGCLQRDETCALLSRNGRRSVEERFSPTAVASRLSDIYDEVLGAAAGTHC